jgi:hypothetical protein
MHDLRSELHDRAHEIKRQIGAENARFEDLLSQLKAERALRGEHLKAQLRLANKLLEFTLWQSRVREALAARIAVAEAAESAITNSHASLVEVGTSLARVDVSRQAKESGEDAADRRMAPVASQAA